MTREEAYAHAVEVAAYLKSKHGVIKVVLFGSTVTGNFLPHHSDIDIYFEGIPREMENGIVFQTWLAFPKLDLDLIPPWVVSDDLLEEIEKTGVVL